MTFDSQTDRRTFLRAMGTTGIVLSTGASSWLLSACGDSDSGKAAPSGKGAQLGTLDVGQTLKGDIYSDVAKTLPRGGSLDVTLVQVAATLNILTSTEITIQSYADPVHDFLERYDTKGNLFPSLAHSVKLVNPTTYRYVLHDATFHNGRKVTADDVVKTVAYVRDPKLASNRAGFLKGVKVRAVDDKTVEFVLPAPNAGFRYNLPGLPIIPIEAKDTLDDHPVGCGPFMFQKWVKDSHIDYKAFDKYWNADLPRLDKLRLTLRSDPQAAAESMQAGQTDVLSSVPTPQVKQFQSLADSGQMKVVTYTPTYNAFSLNLRTPALKDVRVRRALTLALDRENIARVTGAGGLNEVMCTAPYEPSDPNFPKDLEYARDVPAARKLMKEAGAGDINIAFLTLESVTEAMATVMRSNWAEIGVNLKLERIDIPTYIARRTKGDFDVIPTGWFVSPEPSFVLDTLFASNSPSNFSGYKSAKADALLEKGRTTLDPAKRKAVYHDLMKLIFIDEPSHVPISTITQLMAYKADVSGNLMVPSSGGLWRYPVAAKG